MILLPLLWFCFVVVFFAVFSYLRYLCVWSEQCISGSTREFVFFQPLFRFSSDEMRLFVSLTRCFLNPSYPVKKFSSEVHALTCHIVRKYVAKKKEHLETSAHEQIS